MPLPGETVATVAVNETAWPWTVGLTDVPTLALVLAALTVWIKVFDLLPVKLLSPEYWAVIE